MMKEMLALARLEGWPGKVGQPVCEGRPGVTLHWLTLTWLAQLGQLDQSETINACASSVVEDKDKGVNFFLLSGTLTIRGRPCSG